METRIGIRLETRRLGGQAAAPALLAALPELAARAEAAGIHAVWLGEDWPGADAGLPAALPLCAAVAAATRRVRIGSALLPLPLHHPLRVAEDAATVDRLSAGRLDLGVGLGADPAGLADFGVDEAERVARFEEALELLRLAWAQEPVNFEGRHFRVRNVSVHPKPVQAGGPQLWVGARLPAAQARAALGGAGLLVPRGADPGPYLEACRRAGQGARLAWLVPPDAEGDDLTSVLAAEVASLRGPGEGPTVQVILGVGLGGTGGEGAAEAVGALDRALALAERLRGALT